MEISFVYSPRDSRQTVTINVVRQYIQERGIQAKLVETEMDVTSPTIVINGHTLKERRVRIRSDSDPLYPRIEDITNFLESQCWLP